MLKRLELVGFKSFADKTTFEFPAGITAVVGPNGSGKSNVVDAVRWIMGEQSAKSLRGGEMADVIFNGSSTRRSFGLAEVTMTFDNARRQLSTDSEEVQITRRVYRTGEGEYLINGQVCRLKDIKDLFLGSGAGNDAYSIIEQGKVDVLLQASTKDRRSIFEEAAGISRFKARKIETLRKLERVDQNLSRVRDIIDEVEKQLRSVKLQAAKAQRFQEYTARLKELRVALGLTEYRQLHERLTAENLVLDGLRLELDHRAARAGACEAEAGRLEMFLADLEDELRQREARLSGATQQIRTAESTQQHESSLSADLETELQRTRRRRLELAQQLHLLQQSTGRAQEEWAAAQVLTQGQQEETRRLEETLSATVQQHGALQQQVTLDKAEHLEQMRRAAHLQNNAVASKAHVDNLRREHERLRLRSVQAAENLASIDVELEELKQGEVAAQGRLASARQSLATCREEFTRLKHQRDTLTESLSLLRQQRSALSSRVDVLDGLIRTHEGLGAGVREVFRLIEKPEPGPWAGVLGMLADFLTVKREYAHLIDLALGDWAQRFLVRDFDQLVQALQQQPAFTGRVSFLPLSLPPTEEMLQGDSAYSALRHNGQVEVSVLSRVRSAGPVLPAPEHPGLVAPAEQLVSCDHPELADLPAQLLGHTLIVRDLATARALAAHAPGFRLVTLQGELLEEGGTLTVGAFHADSGWLSRKSQLQEVREQLAALERTLVKTESEWNQVRDQLVQAEVTAGEKQQEIEVLAEQAADLKSRIDRHRDRREGLHAEVTVNQGELQRIDTEVETLDRTCQLAQDQAHAADAQVQKLHERLHAAETKLLHLERARQEQQQASTLAQVALAKAEERLRNLGDRHRQAASDLEQRLQEDQTTKAALATCQQRLAASQLTALRAGAALAQAFLDREATQVLVNELAGQREQKRTDRARLAQQAQAARTEWRTQQEQFHARELESTNLRHQLDTLVQRLREDYEIDLAQMYQDVAESMNSAAPQSLEPGRENEIPSTESVHADAAPGEERAAPAPGQPGLPDPAAAQEEIAELRRKLSRLGSVNMEALQELQELEVRASTLQAQWDDLTQAKRSLEEVIGKINQDSRRLFEETFATIRGHFQELFRKLFGGGQADVVLEDETDVLESGIEIVARPPGKELRSISLLSGGEKTMTAVALLLAIFRSKPSPFCILDEVDAALDEANIARFTGVLREFTESSQFIVVTHSKKTMAVADVLYGVTMQESGISKQVAVRFEDWVDEPAEPTAQSA